MNANNKGIVYKDLSYKVTGIAMEVFNTLGSGFLEKVYENAMMTLFRKEGINAQQQAPVKVHFHGEVVGEYFADILVDDRIILELKTGEKIIDVHRAQALNYLKAVDKKLAIIMNFGKEKLEYERLVL
jgi:GxxExxY protein